MSNHRIDRTNIHQTRLLGISSRFHKILNKGLCHKQNKIKAFNLLHLLDENIQFTFRLREFLRTMHRPKILITHHGTGFHLTVTLEFKCLIRNFIKFVMAICRTSLYLKLLYELHQSQLYNHLVTDQNMFTRRQLLKILHNIHFLYKVYIRTLRNTKFGTTDPPC